MAKTNTQGVYPLHIHELGEKAKKLYDTIYEELTNGADAMSPQQAAQTIEDWWDEAWSRYDSALDEQKEPKG